jgi:hypothetical protein
VREFLTLGVCVLAPACSVDQTTDFAGDASPDGHTGSGGFPGKENCENAEDDDSDGLIDCADDECFTYTCAAAVPEGWTGPVALYLGADAPPECPASGGFTNLALEGGILDVPALTCPACSCNPAGVGCTPSVVTYTELGCLGAPILEHFGNGCINYDGSSTQRSFKLYANPPGGACTASADVPTIPAPTFVDKARVCRRPNGVKTGSGCFADSCVPKPEPPFELCVYRNDPAPCPSGYGTAKTIVTKFVDERSCAPCTCATNCTATAVGFDFCGATTVLGAANLNDQCVNLNAAQNSLGMDMLGAPVCAAAGGEALGSVVETQVTVCCKA